MLLYFTFKLWLFQLRKEGLQGEKQRSALTCKTSSNTGFEIKHFFQDDIGILKTLLFITGFCSPLLYCSFGQGLQGQIWMSTVREEERWGWTPSAGWVLPSPPGAASPCEQRRPWGLDRSATLTQTKCQTFTFLIFFKKCPLEIPFAITPLAEGYNSSLGSSKMHQIMMKHMQFFTQPCVFCPSLIREKSGSLEGQETGVTGNQL